MTLHNYRSRQVHKTLNGVNPSSSFRDMHSAKSGTNLWQIWQVFGLWASPYGANGQITTTVHNYRPRQFHRTSNGENLWSIYRDMGSASLAAARPAEPWRQYPSSPKGWKVKICSCPSQDVGCFAIWTWRESRITKNLGFKAWSQIHVISFNYHGFHIARSGIFGPNIRIIRGP